MSIPISEMAEEIAKGLTEYSQEVAEIVKEVTDEVAEIEVKKLKKTSPKKSTPYYGKRAKQGRKPGDYAKSWTRKKTYESRRAKRDTVYNKGHYQLTHLLENGYFSNKIGHRVAPQEHIKQREEESKKLLEQKIRQRTGNA